MGLPATAAGSFKEPPVEVMPCNWKTLLLFTAMQTQWRVGMNGATGLDYAALPVVAKGERIRLTPRRISGLRVMEAEALRVMNERRQK